MNRVAVFDVDGTLLPRPSTEVRFVTYLLREKVLGAASLAAALSKAVSYGLHRGVSLRNCPRYWLQKLRLEDLEQFGERFFREILCSCLRGDMVDLIHSHRRQGYRTALLSGAPEFLLVPLGRHLHTDAVMGTRLRADAEGRVMGSIEPPRPHGVGKVHHLLHLRDMLAADLQQSIGFANEGSDAYHLALLGQPVAVNPDRQLKRIASLLGWPRIISRDNHGRQQEVGRS